MLFIFSLTACNKNTPSNAKTEQIPFNSGDLSKSDSSYQGKTNDLVGVS